MDFCVFRNMGYLMARMSSFSWSTVGRIKTRAKNAQESVMIEYLIDS